MEIGGWEARRRRKPETEPDRLRKSEPGEKEPERLPGIVCRMLVVKKSKENGPIEKRARISQREKKRGAGAALTKKTVVLQLRPPPGGRWPRTEKNKPVKTKETGPRGRETEGAAKSPKTALAWPKIKEKTKQRKGKRERVVWMNGKKRKKGLEFKGRLKGHLGKEKNREGNVFGLG